VFAKQATVARRLQARRILVVGNSVASSLANEGLSKVATEPRSVVVDDGKWSCDFPPARLVRDAHDATGGKPYDCTATWQAAIAKFRPDIAVLALGDVHQQLYFYDGRWMNECRPGFAAHYQDALAHATGKLSAHGAKVVLTTAAYSLFIGGERDIAPIRALTKCANNQIRRFVVEHPSVQLIDLQALICPNGRDCRLELDHTALRPDGVHYGGRGARLVAIWMLRQLGFCAAPSRLEIRDCHPEIGQRSGDVVDAPPTTAASSFSQP
jgi:hypothetical protein